MYNFKLTEGPRPGLATLFDPGQRRSGSGELIYSQYVSDDFFWVLNVLRTWSHERPRGDLAAAAPAGLRSARAGLRAPELAQPPSLTNVGEHFIGSEYLNSSKVFLKRNIKSEKDLEQKSQAWANDAIFKINKKIFTSHTNFSKSSLKRLDSNIRSDRLFHGHTPEREIALDYVNRFASDLESKIFNGPKEERKRATSQFARFINKNQIYRIALSDRMAVLADHLESKGFINDEIESRGVKGNPAKSSKLKNLNVIPTLIVSRHPSFIKYLMERGLVNKSTKTLEHVTAKDVRGQHVLGTLPGHLAIYAASVTEVPMRLTMADRKIMQRGDLPIERIRAIAGKPVTYWVRPNSSPGPNFKKVSAEDLIFHCQKLWTKYYNRPTKRNLNLVFEHLEKMKLSKSKKVQAERLRCLKAASKERA